jgi:hypothetical protein
LVSGDCSVEDIKKRVNITEKLLSYVKEYPTWSFDAKIAGTIGIALLGQIIVIIWNFIQFLAG